MDNKKRNIHNSGPLGMLIKTGQVKKLDEPDEQNNNVIEKEAKSPLGGSYFKTQSGIEFTEHELTYVDPNECEPWKYANRQDDELGDIEELIESIRTNKQLQPALVRTHPTPHDKVKYEVIFGRRRHIACLKLGIPFLVIKKEIKNVQEAIATQDAENKFRNDVSNYSNALLYKRLLADGIFKNERELAEKLRMPYSTLNDLMAFTKIPTEVIEKIPDVHSISKIFAVKVASLLKTKSKSKYEKLLKLAPKIGVTITSPSKLLQLIESKPNAPDNKKPHSNSKLYKAENGKKLFTLKYDQRGAPSLVLNKETFELIDMDELCNLVQHSLQLQLEKSGYPD